MTPTTELTWSQAMALRNPNCVQEGTRVIRFQIVSEDPTCRRGIGEILARPLDHYVPGSFLGPDPSNPSKDGTVFYVTDPTGCFLNEPNEEMTGRVGYAAYLQPVRTGSLPCTDGYEDDLAPRWEIISMCCRSISCT